MIKAPGVAKLQTVLTVNISSNVNNVVVDVVTQGKSYKITASPSNGYNTIQALQNYFISIQQFLLGYENVKVSNYSQRSYVRIEVKGKHQQFNASFTGYII